MKFRLVRVGSSVGIVIPKSVLLFLGKKLGDYINIEIKEDK